MHRSLALLVAGLLVEAGCLWIWHASPRLTAIYNAEFTREFFAAFPALAPLTDVGPFVDASDSVVRLLVGLLTMSVGYLLALAVVPRTATWMLMAFAALFRLTFAMLPGLFSTDVFSYVMYGRIAAVHGQNPYVATPSAFPDDPFLGWVFPFWRDQPSVYGALWADLSQALSAATATWSPFAQVTAYRVAIISWEAIGLVAVWWLLGRLQPRDRPWLWLAYAWNPLIVFDLVGATHSDATMLALLLLGLVLVLVGFDAAAKQGGPAAAGLMPGRGFTFAAASRGGFGVVLGLTSVALSALVKFATALVLVPLAVTWVAQARLGHQRLVRLALGLGIPLVVGVALWWSWLARAADPDSSLSGAAHVTRQLPVPGLSAPGAIAPLADAASGRLVLNSAPDLLALTVADQILVPHGVPDDAAREVARFWTRLLTRGVFAAWFVWELLRIRRRRPDSALAAFRTAVAASARLLLGLPLLVLTWVWSWYFAWSLALAVLLGVGSRLPRLAVAYTLVVLPVVYAHQYLNEQLSGAWVVAMAVSPLLAVAPIRRPAAVRRLIVSGGTRAMNLRTLPPSWGITMVRVMAGLIITVAALEKFNGGGFDAFTKTAANLGLPVAAFWGVFIPLLELIGGLMLLLGLGARWIAFLFIVEFFVTAFVLKVPRQPPFGGWDSMRIDLMLWAAVIAVAAVGPGAFALESLLLRRGRADMPMAGRAVPG